MTAMMAMMMEKISMMMVVVMMMEKILMMMMMTKLSILSTGCGCSVGRQGALNHTRREGRAAQTEDKDDRDDRDKDDDHAHDGAAEHEDGRPDSRPPPF